MSTKKKISKPKLDPLIRKLVFWSTAIFVLKMLIIYNIGRVSLNLGDDQSMNISGIWLGADGDNYLKGYQALLKDGVFSPESILNYWPAGYPLFILLLSILGKSWVLTTLAVIQSMIFSYSAYFFTKHLLTTKLRNISRIVLILILLNPTLVMTQKINTETSEITNLG